MNTEIKFLEQLETDLQDVAGREMARLERATLQGVIRKNTGRGWTRVVGVAAAFLIVAGAVGFVFGGGGGLGGVPRPRAAQVAAGGGTGASGEKATPAPMPAAVPGTVTGGNELGRSDSDYSVDEGMSNGR